MHDDSSQKEIGEGCNNDDAPGREFSTAFGATAGEMRRRFADLDIDATTMRRPLALCDLTRCGGGCCHDGAILSREEAEVIARLVESESEFFVAEGLDPSQSVIERADTPDAFRTALVPRDNQRLVADWPAHFPNTACIFLDGAHLCRLQKLALARGRHPWHWKPIACWMHPLQIDARGTLRVPVGRHDELAGKDYPGFAAFTGCGRENSGGLPAATVLRGELDALGTILGRDLAGEAVLLEERERR